MPFLRAFLEANWGFLPSVMAWLIPDVDLLWAWTTPPRTLKFLGGPERLAARSDWLAFKILFEILRLANTGWALMLWLL